MEKLIELLNEFRPAVSCANFKEHYEFIDDDIYLIREGMNGEEEQFPMYVCYKKGDFIKWLVEKDKIDHKLVLKYEKIFGISITSGKEYEIIIMLLAISDTPIDDLVLYLK